MSGSEVAVRTAQPVAKLVRKGSSKGKGLSSFFTAPARYQRPASNKDSKFYPTVHTGWYYGLLYNMQGTAMLGGAIDGFASVVSVPAVGFGSGNWGIALGVFAALQSFWLVPLGMAVPLMRERQRNFKALLAWMHARYGITLSSKQGLGKVIFDAEENDGGTYFADASGRVLALEGSRKSGFIVELGEDDAGEHPLTASAKLPQVKQKVATVLPRKLQEDHQAVLRLIAKLTQRELSPESDHVVGRASRDLDKALSLYGDLHELEVVTDAQVANVARILKQLRAELNEVLQRETEWALNALSVETTYVASREERPGIKMKK